MALLSVDSLHQNPKAQGQAAPEGSAEDKRYRLHRRFDRLGRLYGDGAVERLMSAKVVVFGLGGVGSWAAESLARSAVGHLLLVDSDEVCVTNANRQLQALRGNIGKPKCDVLAERLRLVNPQANIVAAKTFYKEESSEELLTSPWGGEFDFVLDCIDNMTAKAHLLATCRAKGIPVIASMGAAGKMDPSLIRRADLAKTEVCRMARELRKLMRKKHDFPQKGEFGIPAIYSLEERSWPRELSYDGGQGFRCVCPHKNPDHGCDSRSLIDGNVSFVTGSFGLQMAAHVVNTLVAELSAEDNLQTAAPAAPDRYGYRPQA